jgi:hypothetical protein
MGGHIERKIGLWTESESTGTIPNEQGRLSPMLIFDTAFQTDRRPARSRCSSHVLLETCHLVNLRAESSEDMMVRSHDFLGVQAVQELWR